MIVVQDKTITDFFENQIASTGIAKSGLHVKVAQVETPVKSYRPGQEHGKPTVQELLQKTGELESVDGPGVQ